MCSPQGSQIATNQSVLLDPKPFNFGLLAVFNTWPWLQQGWNAFSLYNKNAASSFFFKSIAALMAVVALLFTAVRTNSCKRFILASEMLEVQNVPAVVGVKPVLGFVCCANELNAFSITIFEMFNVSVAYVFNCVNFMVSQSCWTKEAAAAAAGGAAGAAATAAACSFRQFLRHSSSCSFNCLMRCSSCILSCVSFSNCSFISCSCLLCHRPTIFFKNFNEG